MTKHSVSFSVESPDTLKKKIKKEIIIYWKRVKPMPFRSLTYTCVIELYMILLF